MIVSITLLGPANATTGERETIHESSDHACKIVPLVGDVLELHGCRWRVVAPRVHVQGSIKITAERAGGIAHDEDTF